MKVLLRERAETDYISLGSIRTPVDSEQRAFRFRLLEKGSDIEPHLSVSRC